MAYDYYDLGRDSTYCQQYSEQRCARCQQIVPVSSIVQVPGIGQICEPCDDELLGEAMTTRFPDLAGEDA